MGAPGLPPKIAFTTCSAHWNTAYHAGSTPLHHFENWSPQVFEEAKNIFQNATRFFQSAFIKAKFPNSRSRNWTCKGRVEISFNSQNRTGNSLQTLIATGFYAIKRQSFAGLSKSRASNKSKSGSKSLILNFLQISEINYIMVYQPFVFTRQGAGGRITTWVIGTYSHSHSRITTAGKDRA